MGSNPTENRLLRAFLKVKLGHSRPPYFYFRLSQTIDRETYKIAEARNLVSEATVCQLRHYHCPPLPLQVLLPLPYHYHNDDRWVRAPPSKTSRSRSASWPTAPPRSRPRQSTSTSAAHRRWPPTSAATWWTATTPPSPTTSSLPRPAARPPSSSSR